MTKRTSQEGGLTCEREPGHEVTETEVVIVNEMVEEGFDPDGSSYGAIAVFCLGALRKAGYRLLSPDEKGPPA